MKEPVNDYRQSVLIDVWVLLKVCVQSSNSLSLHCPVLNQMPKASVHPKPLLRLHLGGL